MTLFEIVMKLNGPISHVGKHEVDQLRLENMKSLTLLVDKLLFEINTQARYSDRPEASVAAIGIHARDFLNEIKDTDLT